MAEPLWGALAASSTCPGRCSTYALTVRGSLVGNPQALRELVDHFRAGRIRPIPIRGESIEKVNEGLAALRAGRVQGRLVHLLAPNRAFWKKG